MASLIDRLDRHDCPLIAPDGFAHCPWQEKVLQRLSQMLDGQQRALEKVRLDGAWTAPGDSPLMVS
jgi:hypothetical protein